jgi:CheY-like chemotaxis protein/two-component sensor histidine kinase
MERQLLHLVRITDDLLDVARITQSKLEMRRQRIDLRSAVHSALETIRPAMEAQRQVLHVDLPAAPLWADADFTRLSQVFSNLLHNAVKYTGRDGSIRVVAQPRGDTAVFTFEDSGVGIPADMLPVVFDMFTQFPGHRDRSHGGLGIGLTLAKRLVELHGGTIDVRSEGHGRGSTFTVTLPMLQPAEGDVQPPARQPIRSSGPCRVLIADDNPDTVEMMQLMLSLHGHDVSVASDGVAAVAAATAVEPQIVFLDIGMPRMDGYEAARRIRQALGTRVVLVALTGWGQDEDKHKAHEAGFDLHLTKPPDPEVLERLISECGTKRS